MKNKKNLYLNLLIFIGSSLLIVAGVLMAVLCKNNRLIALGGLLICVAALFILMGIARIAALYSVNKEKRQQERKELAVKQKREKLLGEALKAFERKTDYPATNTVKLINDGLEFFVEGRYVCIKDFKNVSGYHLAFEIRSTGLKRMPEDYDDVCDLEGNGVLIMVGYHDGEALEKYANDNGVILQNTLENSIGQTITLTPDRGYNFYIWTVEGDEIDYRFVKIVKCENDVLTVSFLLNVPSGLNDIVEGAVELKKDTEDSSDIHALINKIKRKQYNTLEVSNKEVQSIKKANPFLPESYITFLEKVGSADLDWIDVGRNAKTQTNLNDDEVGFIKDILADHNDINVDDFYFIGVDNGDGYYAFSRKPDDKKVYVFSYESSDIAMYDTFEEFLYEVLSI